ncbi:type II toxin-antitoxin system VapC family toxin [Nonomuraea sp. MCN248]|uniref:Ribonuclease VapC n=1 Tax=Nonomuraea corallina TaxID=2989783 RepID=A0ABT4SD71_9ACTN|nr:type II toxin-antitoxin system VapC family toxin [Nonomuraea corallina]MDA0634910.1 type II toxin-antitoxin system VapC family toxin [Nonomuraea corallina]
MLLLDINVLVNAFRPEVVEHKRYTAFLEDLINGDSSYAVSDFVVNGFIRIVTNRKVYINPDPLDRALTFAQSYRNQPHAVVVTPEDRHWDIFTRLCRRTGAVGKLAPDAYLAALAIEHGCEFVTCDRDFAKFEGLRWRSPLH